MGQFLILLLLLLWFAGAGFLASQGFGSGPARSRGRETEEANQIESGQL